MLGSLVHEHFQDVEFELADADMHERTVGEHVCTAAARIDALRADLVGSGGTSSALMDGHMREGRGMTGTQSAQVWTSRSRVRLPGVRFSSTCLVSSSRTGRSSGRSCVEDR